MNDTIPILKPHRGALSFGGGKLTAVYVSLAMIGAVLWPIQQNWREKPVDNFPLSYYPMFSAKREATEAFHYLLGHDAQGARYIIPYQFAGSGGLNSVRRQIRRIVEDGRGPQLV